MKKLLILLLVLMCLAQGVVFADESIGIFLYNSVFAPNEEFLVEVSGITDQMVEDEAYVSIYKEGAGHDQYMDWQRPEAGSSTLTFEAPSEPGSYEMRLYSIDHVYTDESFLLSVPFKVVMEKKGKISLEKDAYLAQQQIPVTVTDITEDMVKSGAFVAIYKKGAGHDDYITYQYPKVSNSVLELEAPNLR